MLLPMSGTGKEAPPVIRAVFRDPCEGRGEVAFLARAEGVISASSQERVRKLRDCIESAGC